MHQKDSRTNHEKRHNNPSNTKLELDVRSSSSM